MTTTRDIWFIFALVLVVILFEFAPKVGGVLVALIAVYVVLVPLGPIFRE